MSGGTCRRCGAPVEEDFVVCPKCGLKLKVQGKDVAEIVLIIVSILCSLGAMYLFWVL